jgi:hypothetical protein
MWRKRNRRKRERRAWPRSVVPLEAASVEDDGRAPDTVFTALELDFFRRAEELYRFEPWAELEADSA